MRRGGQDEHPAGPEFVEHPLKSLEQRRQLTPKARGVHVKTPIRRTHTQLLEKHLAQVRSGILAGVNKDVPRNAVDLGDDAGEADNLGPRAQHGHDARPVGHA